MSAEAVVGEVVSPRDPLPWVSSFDERTLRVAEAMRDLDIQHRRFRDSAAAFLRMYDSEFGALTLIGNEGEVTPKRLATELRLTTGAVTSVLDRLTGAGLLERHAHPTDRRSVLVRLSPEGERRRDWIYESYVAAVAYYCSVTDPEYVENFLSCVRTATLALEDRIDTLS